MFFFKCGPTYNFNKLNLFYILGCFDALILKIILF